MRSAVRRHPRAARSVRTVLAATLVCLSALLLLAASPASAHVVPTSTIQLAIGDTAVTAAVAIPVSDVEAATGIDLGDQSRASVEAHAEAIEDYLLAHFTPTSDDGRSWTVFEAGLDVVTTGDPASTGRYAELETTFTLTPPSSGATVGATRSFNLGYTAIVDKVATHVVIVTVDADTTTASFAGAYEVGTIRRNTITDTVEPLHVDLGTGRGYRAFVSMFTLGIQHIEEGTDHQLFLLTLLLPAPLMAQKRRWAGPVPVRSAVRRITTITLSFTLGHSVTLALGAVGVPVPQGLVEALIAVSILVAAVHAIRPIFAGREAAVAAAFGLVHGLAFSESLRELHLSGGRLVLALLGFNLGIETMQLAVVVLVLPPLILLARTGVYPRLRTVAAAVTAVAALGWLGARLGAPNPVAGAADHLGSIAVPVVVALWLVAGVIRRAGAAPPSARVGRPVGGEQHAVRLAPARRRAEQLERATREEVDVAVPAGPDGEDVQRGGGHGWPLVSETS